MYQENLNYETSIFGVPPFISRESRFSDSELADT